LQFLHAVTAAPNLQEQKKPTWRNTRRDFDHVGLLANEPPGTAGLLFI
jgi:hypothetical protein